MEGNSSITGNLKTLLSVVDKDGKKVTGAKGNKNLIYPVGKIKNQDIGIQRLQVGKDTKIYWVDNLGKRTELKSTTIKDFNLNADKPLKDQVAVKEAVGKKEGLIATYE